MNLGILGNKHGLEQFNNYKKKFSHCSGDLGPNRRVLITSFGPFKNKDQNISSQVLNKMANQDLSLNEESYGGRSFQKTISLGGEEIDICFLNLSVMWELSSAITIDQALIFRPDFILMMGSGLKNKIIIETQAINKAKLTTGYDYSAKELKEYNTPMESWILPTRLDPLFLEPMTWDWQKIDKALRPLMTKSPDSLILKLEEKHRETNIYICNALSFSVLHALKNKEVSFFGDQLSFFPDFNQSIPAGFLHLPSNISKENIDFSAMTIKKLVQAQLESDF